MIDLTNNNSNATDRFVVQGDYIGHDGDLNLQTVLDSDDSPSDRLVIDGGQAIGSTRLFVTNVGGLGALTLANGIRVINAINGATTTAGAFTLGGPVAAGPFEYLLFRGGMTPDVDNDNDWFLRNTVSPPPPPPPPGPPIPNVRPEVPGHVMAPFVAERMGLMTMGTFHQRRGDQSLLIGDGAWVYTAPEPQGADVPLDDYRPPAAMWGRIFGAESDLSTGANVSVADFEIAPSFDGRYWGLQAGSDLVGIEHDNGHVDRFGLFYTHAEASGDISGNVLGGVQLRAGTLDLTEDSIVGYWTHLSPSGWYVDVVAKYAWLNGSSESDRGIGADLDGNSIAASVETGVPFRIAEGWTIEPQAQLIWQRIDFDDTSDPFSEIRHEAFDSITGRLGARLKYRRDELLAHLGANLWHGFSEGPSAVTFNTVPI
ncbi:MAG: autotransporter outer membrane beta-barrel domain-containing protein, partial [Pseudaminobacter sp.]